MRKKPSDVVGEVLATIFFTALVVCVIAIAVALTIKAIEAIV